MNKDNPYKSLTNHDIFSGIYHAVYSLTPGKMSGSHTEIFALDGDRLNEIFHEWVIKIEGKKGLKGKIKSFRRISKYLSSRFLLKVGRTQDFAMRLGGASPLKVPRGLISEVFGEIGYSLFPTWRKTFSDSTEAVREIPYFYYGETKDLFLPHMGDFLRGVLNGDFKKFPDGNDDGLFLIYSLEKEKEYSVYDIFINDRFVENKIENSSNLFDKMNDIRKNPLDQKITEQLRTFFNAPITVGVRDALRWLSGSRHTQLNWKQAKELIDDCFNKHSKDNFLLPEINFYIPVPNLSSKQTENLKYKNNEVLDLGVEKLCSIMNQRTYNILGKPFIKELLSDILTYHHSYPEYKLKETMGYVNPTLPKVGLKFIEHLGYLITGTKLPERRNFDIIHFLERSKWKDRIFDKLTKKRGNRLIVKILDLLLSYDLRGGFVSNNEKFLWERLTPTFCTLQERADFLPPGCKKLDQFSLEDLAKTEYSFYLRRYPELAEKLVVFFVLVLRFFLDTDFIPDLRPDEAGINIFILGIWGYISENLIVILYEDENGNEQFKIRFVDNKDHFKQYKREIDKENPLGIAKHAMRIVEPIVVPAMERAIGNFIQIVYENRNGLVKKKVNLIGLIDYGFAIAQEVILKGFDYSSDGLQNFIADGIDDATKIAEKAVRTIVPGMEKKEETRI
jgi:hypothetical protein